MRLSACLSLLVLTALSPLALALQPDLRDLDRVPLHVVPTAISTKALAAVPTQKGSGPYYFAVNVDLPVALQGGRWDVAPDGLARWRSRVYSAGATLLVMEFARFQLPAGASLWIYDVEGRVVQGPYTARNHTPEGKLWTPWVPGESAVIELRVPAAQRENVQLALGRLGHGYKNTRDLGDSGACNIDAVCPLGNDWRDEIRSTVKLQIPSGPVVGLCSGTLVNNVRQDDKPYVLTADHCGIGDTLSPASGVVTYWNFQNSACGGAANASDTQNQTGATLRAQDRNRDMTLIELSQTPSAAFNVHYAGWDATVDVGGSSGLGIHHPAGDAKKISEFTEALVADTVRIETGGPSIPAWRVNKWNQGTTEQGSSGSGLWNQDHKLVGTLSGGSAACSGSVDNDEPDFYARLDRQWTAQTVPAGQLKAWLDPDNTGTLSLGGKNPGAAIALVADTRTLTEDAATTAIDVLANDPAGLTLVSVTLPNRGGTASVNTGNNTVSYRPAANFNGTETFSYTARNSGGQTANATVTVTVNAVNDPPNAVNDNFPADAGRTSDLPVLDNDTTAPDAGETLTISSVGSFSAGGGATISGSVLRYTPAAGFTGTETFTYTVQDGNGGSDTATVTVTVRTPPAGGGGGGGSPAPVLLALLALAALGRRARG